MGGPARALGGENAATQASSVSWSAGAGYSTEPTRSAASSAYAIVSICNAAWLPKRLFTARRVLPSQAATAPASSRAKGPIAARLAVQRRGVGADLLQHGQLARARRSAGEASSRGRLERTRGMLIAAEPASRYARTSGSSNRSLVCVSPVFASG